LGFSDPEAYVFLAAFCISRAERRSLKLLACQSKGQIAKATGPLEPSCFDESESNWGGVDAVNRRARVEQFVGEIANASSKCSRCTGSNQDLSGTGKPELTHKTGGALAGLLVYQRDLF
jgi:hypothetical protein